MVYAVEAWTISGDEEPCEEKMDQSEEFDDDKHTFAMLAARQWAWNRLEEGFAVRMYRR